MRVTEVPYEASEAPHEVTEAAYDVTEVSYDVTEVPYEASEVSYERTEVSYLLPEMPDEAVGMPCAVAETDKGRTCAPSTSVSIGFDMDDIGYGCKIRKAAERAMGRYEF